MRSEESTIAQLLDEAGEDQRLLATLVFVGRPEGGQIPNVGSESLSYCSMAFLVLTTNEGGEFVDTLLGAYLRFMRQPTQAGFDLFWNTLEQMRNSVTDESSEEILDSILIGRSLGFEHVESMGNRPNDVAFSTMLAALHYWTRRIGGRYRVVHDQSKNISEMQW